MIVNYSNQKVEKGDKSIFLAGPTPRSTDVESWRPEAVKILRDLGFDGIVYVPELCVDNRTFNYINQVWWEREALHNADVIVFWVPREMKTMPALTTNVEYGYWIAKNSDKVVYGRPDLSDSNRYLDWLYKAETGKDPANNLTDVLSEAVKNVNNKSNDLDSYELNIIKRVLRDYPEIMTLVGDVQFTPESFGIKNDKKTYGQIFFPDVDPNQLKEFDRTILSVLLYHYIKDDRYDKFVELQSGSNKLSRDTFYEIRSFMKENFDTPEKEKLLLYYMVINDLGKSKKVIDALKEKGIETVDHDLLLNYLLRFDMLPTLNEFSSESKKNLENVLTYGINVGQYIQGECVDYSLNEVLNLTQFEKSLMFAEAMLDIAGVLGHVNNRNGSAVLNQSTADNLLTAADILKTTDDPKVLFDKFLSKKADQMHVCTSDDEIRKTVTRISLMMRLYKREDIETVEDEIVNNADKYESLIHELNESGYDDKAAILLYYSPALLSNTYNYFKKNNAEEPLETTLKVCLPFMQKTINNVRDNRNNNDKGIITVMLRDAALVASEDPMQLDTLEMNILNKDEAVVQKRLVKQNKAN